MRPGLQPEWILQLAVLFGCCAAFIPLPWCVFWFCYAVLCCAVSRFLVGLCVDGLKPISYDITRATGCRHPRLSPVVLPVARPSSPSSPCDRLSRPRSRCSERARGNEATVKWKAYAGAISISGRGPNEMRILHLLSSVWVIGPGCH
jgi:hypothetical protein